VDRALDPVVCPRTLDPVACPRALDPGVETRGGEGQGDRIAPLYLPRADPISLTLGASVGLLCDPKGGAGVTAAATAGIDP
jgi:hypothetical protein